MDNEKRNQVVQMLAETKMVAERKTQENKSSRIANKKECGAELVYIKLDHQSGLADALSAIAHMKDNDE